MSPFMVYLMMQADTIGNVFTVASVLLGFAFIAATIVRGFISDSVGDDDIKNQTKDYHAWMSVKYAQRRVLISLIAAVLMATFMPSTKTIAVMVVLPKLTSQKTLDTMGNEAADLYKLAKDALRSLATDKPKEAPKQ